MNDTKVLACQIDKKLREKMQERIEEEKKLTGKKITVKSYIIGLIEKDLENYKFQENSKTDLKEQPTAKQKEEKELVVEKQKEEKKQQVVEKSKKEDLKKQPIKKKQKEEEEEFE